MALEEIFGMGEGADTAEKPMEEGMEMEAEMEVEEPSEADSLEGALQGLIENWSPTTPEGEKYLADVQDVLSNFGGAEMEPEGEIVEGAEEEGASEEPPEEPGPSVGFDIVAMRKRAAKNALGGE